MLVRKACGFLVVLAAVLLTACGGGDGSDDAASQPVASTEIFQLSTAFENALIGPSSFNVPVAGSVFGINVSGFATVAVGFLTATLFEGDSALQSDTTTTGSINANGQVTSLDKSVANYFDVNRIYLGSFDGGNYGVVSTLSIPATAHVGETGILLVETLYASPAKTSVVGERTTSYEMQSDTATTAVMNIISIERDNLSKMKSSETRSYRITPDGTVVLLSINIFVPGSPADTPPVPAQPICCTEV